MKQDTWTNTVTSHMNFIVLYDASMFMYLYSITD